MVAIADLHCVLSESVFKFLAGPAVLDSTTGMIGFGAVRLLAPKIVVHVKVPLYAR